MKPKLSPWLFLALGILCIAFSAIFVKLAAINGVSAAFYRMFIATVALLPYYLLKRRSKFNVRQASLAFLCGIFFATDVSMWYVAIMRTDATVSTLLGNLAPLWTGMLGFLFYKLKPNRFYWIGTVIALTGVVILLGYENVFHLKVNSGFFLAISASVFYALYLLSSNVVRQSFDTVSFMMFALLGSVFASFIYTQLTHAPLWGFSTHTWLALLGMGLFSHLLGWLALNDALGHIPSTEASIALLSQSVFTAILATILLGEQISLHQVVGGIIVLLGISLVYIKRTKTIL
jgi:drug/metabolite transporter (DMT)-like permease